MATQFTRTQIQLSPHQAERLRALAGSRHVSVAELIRDGVDKILEQAAVNEADSKIERALNVSGRFRSGQKDVAERHDEYLVDAFLPASE
jgi:Arc/MetJ-type ribon-helix-helix transcriptional regulator